MEKYNHLDNWDPDPNLILLLFYKLTSLIQGFTGNLENRQQHSKIRYRCSLVLHKKKVRNKFFNKGDFEAICFITSVTGISNFSFLKRWLYVSLLPKDFINSSNGISTLFLSIFGRMQSMNNARVGSVWGTVPSNI